MPISITRFRLTTVPDAAIKGCAANEQLGIIPNKTFGILDCASEQLVFTADSDTAYGPPVLDLGIGPMVVELARVRARCS